MTDRREPVRLIGGPMDGWLVTADAPALERDWSADGHYTEAGRDPDGVMTATWEAQV